MKELEYYKQRLTDGKLGRREFMGRAAALGVTVAAATTMASDAAKAAGPKKGGRLKAGLGGGSTTDSLDPATLEDTYAMAVSFGQLRNCLTEINGSGDLVGELATGWEASPDAKTWAFKLRKGVEFHNGKSMTADDVVASFQHHMGKDSKSVATGITSQITDVKKDGNDTVIFNLASGNADWPVLTSDYHLSIFPDGTKGKEFDKGVGTGGYSLVDWEPGVRAMTKRNPNYWKEGTAHFDEIELIHIADATARTNALRTGETHMMNRCERKTVHLLGKVPGINVDTTNGTQHYTVPMRTDQDPFKDNNVRMALKYGVDREAMVKTILRGYGAVGNDHPIPPSNQYYAADLPQRKYDPDMAKHYLKKAGLSNLKVELSAANAAFSGAVDAAVLYKEHAAKAGIDIEVVREPDDGYWSNVWMKKGWCMCYWGGRPTEDWMFSTAYANGANWNDTFWSHDRFNELLVAARAELDSTKRRAQYYEMQKIVSDEGGVVVPMFAAYISARSEKLATPEKTASNWDLDGVKFTERWWFA